jgi:pre-rRNA-processing protein IPI3
MLSEHFCAAISAPSKTPDTSRDKDAGIFFHQLHPLAASKAVLKKSASPPNCLAVSQAHVFSSQLEKAVVHVYNRDKGTQEAIVPFQERIHAVALAVGDSVLVLGTESGRVLLWEVKHAFAVPY